MLKNRIVPLIAALAMSSTASAQTGATSEAADLVKQGQKLESSGKWTEAIALYRDALERNSAQFDAYLGIGRVLDLEGQYAEARQHIEKAIELAPETGLSPALSTMAVAYAFESKAAESAKYYQKVFDRQIQAGAPEAAAGTANALGRVYLESGDAGNAEKWYRTGYETAKKIEKRTPEDVDLWEMRWQHAQGRIAARRKQFDAARKHVDAVRTIVERGTLDEGQRLNLPHLAGYVAFYEGNHDAAIAELSKAEPADPFILGLLAQSYEQKGEKAKASELYERILQLPGHSLQAAFSRPLARRKQSM
jgi:tetratricopeptide (TPR) repeat protein